MLDGRIDMTEGEEQAVDALQAELGRGALSRRDPGDEGPVLFKLRDGRVYEISADGATREVKGQRDG